MRKKGGSERGEKGGVGKGGGEERGEGGEGGGKGNGRGQEDGKRKGEEEKRERRGGRRGGRRGERRGGRRGGREIPVSAVLADLAEPATEPPSPWMTKAAISKNKKSHFVFLGVKKGTRTLALIILQRHG